MYRAHSRGRKSAAPFSAVLTPSFVFIYHSHAVLTPNVDALRGRLSHMRQIGRGFEPAEKRPQAGKQRGSGRWWRSHRARFAMAILECKRRTVVSLSVLPTASANTNITCWALLASSRMSAWLILAPGDDRGDAEPVTAANAPSINSR